MSPFAILLRVVLCIGLILNGSGYAVAATQMQIEHATKVSEGMRAGALPGGDVAAVLPCHEDPGKAAIGPDGFTADPETTGNDPAQPEHPIPDCCKSSNCAGACLHAFAAMPGLCAGSIVTNHASSVRPMRTGHPAPALPHLIRPPIG